MSSIASTGCLPVRSATSPSVRFSKGFVSGVKHSSTTMSGIGTVTIPDGSRGARAACGIGELLLALRGRPDRRLGHAASSSKRFQSSKVNVKAAVVVTPCPYTRSAALRGTTSSHAMSTRCASGCRDERLDHVVEDRPPAHLGELPRCARKSWPPSAVASVICMKPWLRSASTSASSSAVSSCMTSVTIGPPS